LSLKIIPLKLFTTWAFPFLKEERAGLSTSIFSKQKRIYVAIPNAATPNKIANLD